MVIFKGKTARSLKTVTKRNDIVIGHQQKGWMDHAQMCAWIREVLLKYTRTQHCLLVFDSFKGHLVEDFLEALKRANAFVVVLLRWLHQQSTACGCVPKSAEDNQRHGERPVGRIYDQQHDTRPSQ